MRVTSKGSESWRTLAAHNFKLGSGFSTMAKNNRSTSATVLWLRQCLACGRDCDFRGLRPQGMQVLQYVITYQEVMTHTRVLPSQTEIGKTLSAAEAAGNERPAKRCQPKSPNRSEPY